MEPLGIAIVALAVGLAAGALIVMARPRTASEDLAGPASARLEARLDVQAAELRRIADGAGTREGMAERLRDEMTAARRSLDQLTLLEEQRRLRQSEESEVIRRLSAVLAGGSTKGRAGENVLRDQLSELPPGMLVTDFRVNGKVVEFGLRLPDGRRLPIDSKWPARSELESLDGEDDPLLRETAAREVERIVSARVRDVSQYLDPALTSPVAVAAVPDAAYAVLRRAHAEAFTRGVIVVPYSSALPIVLFLYSLVARYGDPGDVYACLAEVGSLLDAMEGVLENKIARAATMVANGADEFRSHLGKARGSVARGRAVVPEDGIEREPGGEVLRVVT